MISSQATVPANREPESLMEEKALLFFLFFFCFKKVNNHLAVCKLASLLGYCSRLVVKHGRIVVPKAGSVNHLNIQS